MDAPDGLDPEYADLWLPILTGWLRWPRSRFDAWTSAWDYAIRNIEHQRVWFYHEPPLYYVLPLLVPEPLADSLSKRRTGRMYNDLAELMYEGIEIAITGQPITELWASDDFDWNSAKSRVERVLGDHSATLPSPSQVSSYERRILEYAP